MHWSSQTPSRHKRNAVACELHRALMTSDDFEKVIKIGGKYANAGLHYGFINETIKKRDFQDLINFFFMFQINPKPLYGPGYHFAVKMNTFRGHFLKSSILSLASLTVFI